MAESGVTIDHPNRRKAASKLTRAIVVLLLLVSAGVTAIVTLALGIAVTETSLEEHSVFLHDRDRCSRDVEAT